MAPFPSPRHLWRGGGPFLKCLLEFLGGVCLLIKGDWELFGDIVQYVILGYTNKLDSDVLLFIYNTLPRSTTYIRLAFDASIKM